MLYEETLEWGMFLFGRQNPALPPRRRVRTAARWLTTAAIVAKLSPSGDEWLKWAAMTHLDVGRRYPKPPGWNAVVPAGWRFGGVEDDILRKLAKYILWRTGECSQWPAYFGRSAQAELVRRAWHICYPKTVAALCHPVARDIHDPHFVQAVETAIQDEWELIWTTDYCREWHGFIRHEQMPGLLSEFDIPEEDLAIRDRPLVYERAGGVLQLHLDCNCPPNGTVVFLPCPSPGPVPPLLIERAEYTTHCG